MNVTATITVEIGEQKHEMSVADARRLRDALNAALNEPLYGRQPTLPAPPIVWPNYPAIQPPAQPYFTDNPVPHRLEVWCGTAGGTSKTVFDQ